MFQILSTSSLEKIFLENIHSITETNSFSILEGEVGSFQFVFSSDVCGAYSFELISDSEISIEKYLVKSVPVGIACSQAAQVDNGYISHSPGLYPDLLQPIEWDWVQVNFLQQAMWIRVKGSSGIHKVTVVFRNAEKEIVAQKSVTVNIVPAVLPKQSLVFTQWFYTDCILSYYHCEAFSERHWELIEKFLLMAHQNGINMILTPIFTPSTDTEIGRERPTVQLVEIEKSGNQFTFDFSRFRRWVTLCKKIGFENFEMSHLFTQWGAKSTPKIVATVDGVQKRIFGWDISSSSPEYENFLSQFLPELIEELRDSGIAEHTYFHISDEPRLEDLSEYSNAYHMAAKYLDGFKIIDAISDFDFFKRGILHIPVPATDSIRPFLEARPEERWCYYCCTQSVNVSNRFIALPAARNRSIGLQLYKHKIDGFLHWGYNFYYSQYSRLVINPFLETDAFGTFPSGDSFSVYPGDNGPMPAIGLFVFFEALQDMRALQLLETFLGFDQTVRFVEGILGSEITFEHCFTAEQILAVRDAVNRKIAESVSEKTGYSAAM